MPIYYSARLAKVIGSVTAGVIAFTGAVGLGLVIKDSTGSQKFIFTASGGHLSVTGSLTSGLLTSCDSVDTTSTGTFICGTDDGAGALTQAIADNRYVNTSGDSMTGNLLFGYGGGLSLSGSFVSATGSTRRYIVLHSGSGSSAATGTNVLGGLQSPFVGSITQVKCYVGEAGNNGLTTFTVKAGGTSVTSTACSVDLGELSSSTAATPSVIDSANNSLTEAELITVDMTSPSTTSPITFAVELTVDVTTFP